MQARHDVLDAGIIATLDDFTEKANAVEVLNRTGDAEIYFTVSDAAHPIPAEPGVRYDDTYVVPAAIGAVTVAHPGTGIPVVKLISDGTPGYSVTVELEH